MRLKKSISLFFLVFFLIKVNGFSYQKYNLVSKQLDIIYDDDQKYRRNLEKLRIIHGQKSVEFNTLRKLIVEHDSVNIHKIEKILDKYGWLSSNDVGEKANRALFLVIQHSHISIQEKYLPLLQIAVKNKKANPEQLAFLEDRIALANGREQIFGSQLYFDNNKYVLYPTFDQQNLDKRRALVGLSPISVYLKNFGINYEFIPKKEFLNFCNLKTKLLYLLLTLFLIIIFSLFKNNKTSSWYWLFIISFIIEIINIYVDYYRPNSMIKQYHENWILFSFSRIAIIYTSILFCKFICKKVFVLNRLLIDCCIILISYFVYYYYFELFIQQQILQDSSIVFFPSIIEPIFYTLLYLIISSIIYIVKKKFLILSKSNEGLLEK